jgi:hypothetical protein
MQACPFFVRKLINPLLQNLSLHRGLKKPGVQLNCGCKLEFKQGVTSVKDFEKLCADCVALCGLPEYGSLVLRIV